MARPSILEGTKKKILQTISAQAINADETRSVSLENISFPTSFDLGRDLMIVPSESVPILPISRHVRYTSKIGSPPVWTPQALPITLPPDLPPIDPRTILPACPLEPMLRAIQITSPDLVIRDFDLITDRKNLRALWSFFTSGIKPHRIDAEIIGDTLLFYLGWTGGGYHHGKNSYGISFENSFTGPRPETTTAHNRVISYTFGGLKTLVTYQVDACISTTAPNPAPATFAPTSISPSGLQIMEHGSMMPPEHIVEIKTLRVGRRPIIPRTMAQVWFSHTPIIMAGYHDGYGCFSSVDRIDVMERGDHDSWESGNKATLQKVICVIKMIKEHMASSTCKRQAIILQSRGSGQCGDLKFYKLKSNITSLPDDLQKIWA